MLEKLFLLLLFSFLLSCSSPAPERPTPYVQVLGIAQDAGYPQIGCFKDCCKDTWDNPEKKRLVNCLGLVDPISGKKWMFEATPDIREQLATLCQDTPPDGIFLTHAHMGHYTGLMHLGREAMGASEIPVYAMPRMQVFLRSFGPWSQLIRLNNIDIQPIIADSTIHLSQDLSVTPFLVPHRDEFSETVGYLVEGPTKRLIFIPDIDKWEKWDRSIDSLIQEVDVALLDGTFFANGEIPNRDMSEIPHPFIEESLARWQDLPLEERMKIHFIHFNHTNPAFHPRSGPYQQVVDQGFGISLEGQLFEL